MSEPNGGPARFDLSKLADASRETTVQTAGIRNGPDNPFLERVRESYALDQQQQDSGWREIPMPSDQMWPVITSLRALSQWFGKEKSKGGGEEPIGVHIRVEYQPDGAEGTIEVGPKDFDDVPQDGREIYLKYTGRERLKRGRKAARPAAPAAPDGPAVEDDEESELLDAR